jgi:YegS/Rv2252/BmrU family lipid kinase
VSNTHELTTTRAALVVNTGSRTGRRAFLQARGRLIELGVPLASVHPVHDAAELPDAVAAAVTDGCDLVVLGGGDGTISASVGGLIGTKAVLGVLPLGTANDFARTLEIPNDLDGACEAIANGQVVDVDLGIADDHYFVNVASLGMSVAVTHALTPGLKRRLGSLAYPVATLRAYRGHKPFHAELEFPAGDHPTVSVDRALQVAVGNGRYYGGGNVLSPDADIDDHSLDVYVIAQGGFLDHLAIASSFRSGSFVEHPLVTHVQTREVLVRTTPTQHINVDGEVSTSTPERFRMDANALHVAVPRESAAARMDNPAA